VRPDDSPGLLLTPSGVDPERSLGWQVAAWVETFLCHGPGDIQGDALEFDDEIRAHLALAYAVGHDGRRLIFRDVFSRAKGRAKSELAGAIACAELLGPVRFDHWAVAGETSEWGYEYVSGEPVGRRVHVPLIRCLATEEGQSGNTYDNTAVMLDHAATRWPELFGGLDIGRNTQTSTRIFLAGGGEIRPCTASSAAKDGGKESFAVADETHLYSLPELRSMHRTVSRNMTKRHAGEPWMLETSTMYAPGAQSIAEDAHKYATQIQAGETLNRGLLFDHREGLAEFDWDNEAQLTRALEVAYGPAATWRGIDRIVAEIRDPATSVADARRYFLNIATPDEQRAIDPRVWASRANASRVVQRSERVGLGFDGSYSDDSTALIGCTADGFVFEIAAWDRPTGTRGWTVPRSEVDAVVREAFGKYRVRRMLCDPPLWKSEIEGWERLFGDRVLAFETNQPSRMAPACDRFTTAVNEGTLTHDGTSALAHHVANMARRKVRVKDDDTDGRTRYVFVKASAGKIDRGIAAVLAFEAASAIPKSRARVVNMAEVLASIDPGALAPS
jgi:hypothetical protein